MVNVCALTVTQPIVIMAATIASKFRFPKCIFPPFFEKKADAAPGELQLNSEILFFAKAQRRRAYRCQESAWSATPAITMDRFAADRVRRAFGVASTSASTPVVRQES